MIFTVKTIWKILVKVEYSFLLILTSKKNIMDALINANKALAGIKKFENEPKKIKEDSTIYAKKMP